jgi:Ca-activated chloride channel family protein
MIRPVSSFSTFIRFFFFRNAFVFLIIALAMPIFGSKKVATASESLELVVCLDVSNSMNTMDIADKTTRLDVAKRALIELVNKLGGEKLGLCLFANNAYVHLPITGDYPAIKLFLKDIETDMISNQGTNIASALDASMEMFSNQKTSKGILLITDGENHEEDPTEVLRKIREEDVQLMVLGLGTTQGGPVPKDPRRPEIGYKTDARGLTVVSRINPAFLKKIARSAGGESEVSSSEFPDLSGLLTEIKRMKRSKIDNFDFKVKQERYQMPLLASLLCWLGYLLWSAQFVGWLDRFVK